MTDYVLPWHQDDNGAQRQQRRRHAPGLWAQRRVPGDCPLMPPDWPGGAFSTCGACPWNVCTPCRPNDEWLRWHNQQADEQTPPRRTWWARLTGRTPREDT